jgi:hypothetical protein
VKEAKINCRAGHLAMTAFTSKQSWGGIQPIGQLSQQGPTVTMKGTAVHARQYLWFQRGETLKHWACV